MKAWKPVLLAAMLVPASSDALRTPLAQAVSVYGSSLATRPLETNVITAAVLGFGSDYFAQLRDAESYDRRRGVSIAAFSVAYRGIFQYHAFSIMHNLLKGDALAALIHAGQTTRVLAALERTLFNQFLIVPAVYYPLFFALTGAIQGLSPAASLRRARANFLPLMGTTLKFWLPLNLVQFSVMPVGWQVPFVCAVGFAWTAILSVKAGKCSPEDERGGAAPSLGGTSPTARPVNV